MTQIRKIKSKNSKVYNVSKVNGYGKKDGAMKIPHANVMYMGTCYLQHTEPNGKCSGNFS